MNPSLKTLRQYIDTIDDHLLALLAERAMTAQQIGEAKGAGPAYRPAREARILRRLEERAKGPLPPVAVRAIYGEIIAACRSLQDPLRIGYLGPPGSYSHEAATAIGGAQAELVPHASITEIVQAAEQDAGQFALLPFENSSEGMVAETHKLLSATTLQIVNERWLDIRHCLLSSAADLARITEVYAHPQALGQCRAWLQAHLPKATLVAQPSNSRAAEIVAALPHAAAIASHHAARLYQLRVIAETINDQPANRTRFILLGREAPEPTGSDTTTVLMRLENEPGALQSVLQIVAAQRINLSRIVSQPIAPREYLFYLDLDGHQAEEPLRTALSTIKSHTKDLIIAGSYPKGAHHGN